MRSYLRPHPWGRGYGWLVELNLPDAHREDMGIPLNAAPAPREPCHFLKKNRVEVTGGFLGKYVYKSNHVKPPESFEILKLCLSVLCARLGAHRFANPCWKVLCPSRAKEFVVTTVRSDLLLSRERSLFAKHANQHDVPWDLWYLVYSSCIKIS